MEKNKGGRIGYAVHTRIHPRGRRNNSGNQMILKNLGPNFDLKQNLE